MAVVRKFEIKELQRSSKHTEVRATLSLIDEGGEKFVQIDTYGSASREMPDKVSQSLRPSKAAFNALSAQAAKHF